MTPSSELIATQTLRLKTGINLAFCVAGDRAAHPAVVLLHGFPSSSRSFRDVIQPLSKDAFVVAPDLPGFGASDPLPNASFSAFAEAVQELLDHLEIGDRFLYVHDFGAPVALDLAMRQPDQVLGLIVQNANAHPSGWGPGWEKTREYWDRPTPENEAAATAHLTLEGTRDQYAAGVPDDIVARIDPSSWLEDWRVMNLPGRMQTQRALIADYGRYAARLGAIKDYLKRNQPPALLLWGRHDAFFDLAEVESWMWDLPRMQGHILDGGHFLLETHAIEAAQLMRAFITSR